MPRDADLRERSPPVTAPGPRPNLQAPFPCGQKIIIKTYAHAPALDIFTDPESATEGTKSSSLPQLEL